MPRDPLIGRVVEVRSAAGVVYRGTVRAITPGDAFSERFELISADNSGDVHEVYVADRAADVRVL